MVAPAMLIAAFVAVLAAPHVQRVYVDHALANTSGVDQAASKGAQASIGTPGFTRRVDEDPGTTKAGVNPQAAVGALNSDAPDAEISRTNNAPNNDYSGLDENDWWVYYKYEDNDVCWFYYKYKWFSWSHNNGAHNGYPDLEPYGWNNFQLNTDERQLRCTCAIDQNRGTVSTICSQVDNDSDAFVNTVDSEETKYYYLQIDYYEDVIDVQFDADGWDDDGYIYKYYI